MTNRQFNAIVRENLRAAADHIRRGHLGRWRQCADLRCRDAQNFVPPMESLLVHLVRSRPVAEVAAISRLAGLDGEGLPN